MIKAILLIEESLTFTIENIITLVLYMGGYIFYAKGVRIGLILHFVIMSMLSLGLYAWDKNFVISLTLALISFVLMAFSLYATAKAQSPSTII